MIKETKPFLLVIITSDTLMFFLSVLGRLLVLIQQEENISILFGKNVFINFWGNEQTLSGEVDTRN